MVIFLHRSLKVYTQESWKTEKVPMCLIVEGTCQACQKLLVVLILPYPCPTPTNAITSTSSGLQKAKVEREIRP